MRTTSNLQTTMQSSQLIIFLYLKENRTLTMQSTALWDSSNKAYFSHNSTRRNGVVVATTMWRHSRHSETTHTPFLARDVTTATGRFRCLTLRLTLQVPQQRTNDRAMRLPGRYAIATFHLDPLVALETKRL